MNQTMTNMDAMRAAYPDFTNGTDNRNPVSYKQALSQFDVANNQRYRQRDTNGDGNIDTFCNIFLWDGSRALGCEIPHFQLFYIKGPDGKGMLSGKEFNANAVANWFAGTEDEVAGWREVNQEQAVDRASKGFPTVIIWRNPSGIGHVGWVIPSAAPGLRVAQAGAVNFFDGDYRKGFGNASPLKFYTHD